MPVKVIRDQIITRKICYGDAKLHLKRLKKGKSSFYARETPFVTEIVTGDMEFIYPPKKEKRKYMKLTALWLFRVVHIDAKKYLEASGAPKEVIEYPTSDYNYAYDDSHGYITGTDINHAYWRIASNLGVICDKTYRKGTAAELKSERLAALSTLGREKVYEHYIKGKRRKDTITKEINPELRSIFKTIRHTCFGYMVELSKLLKDDFESYQTDCIYYRHSPESVKLVQEFFESKNLTCKQLVYTKEEIKEINAKRKTGSLKPALIRL